MFSLGVMFYNGDKLKVNLLVGEDWIIYNVSNPEDLPENGTGTSIGLFKYEPQDQYCRWVDVKKIEMQKD